jgi:hypothetical protein
LFVGFLLQRPNFSPQVKSHRPPDRLDPCPHVFEQIRRRPGQRAGTHQQQGPLIDGSRLRAGTTMNLYFCPTGESISRRDAPEVLPENAHP